MAVCSKAFAREAAARQAPKIPCGKTGPATTGWAPRFSLRIFEEGGRLKVQGTAQPSFDAEVVGQDRIEIKVVGAAVQFNRDDTGKVVSVTLRQKGQVLEGKKE